MYLVAIAWMYVVLMMAVVEATSKQGTVLGAVFTFLLYGIGPLGLVLYLLGTPGRRQRQRAAEALADTATATATAATTSADTLDDVAAPEASGRAPHRSSEAAGDELAPERKEP